VVQDPFLVKLFNKPFSANAPDSIRAMIKTPVRINVDRYNEFAYVSKVSSSDSYVKLKFDSSSIEFDKINVWQLVRVDLKSSHFGFINGIKVGMTRENFLKVMDESEFEGEEFERANQYCTDGFKSRNGLTITFTDGLISRIKYGRAPCR
jgi:hypothetical protein